MFIYYLFKRIHRTLSLQAVIHFSRKKITFREYLDVTALSRVHIKSRKKMLEEHTFRMNRNNEMIYIFANVTLDLSVLELLSSRI